MKYIVKIDDNTYSCGIVSLIIGSLYRKIRGWSRPRVIGRYRNVS